MDSARIEAPRQQMWPQMVALRTFNATWSKAQVESKAQFQASLQEAQKEYSIEARLKEGAPDVGRVQRLEIRLERAHAALRAQQKDMAALAARFTQGLDAARATFQSDLKALDATTEAALIEPESLPLGVQSQTTAPLVPPAAASSSCGAPDEDTLAVYGRVNRILSSAPSGWHDELRFAARFAASSSDKPSVKTLRTIQSELARLTPMSTEGSWEMKPLVMTMVDSQPEIRSALREQISALPCDFSVYHYDCDGEKHPHFRFYAASPWYVESKKVIRRAFVTGTGCHVEATKEVLVWLLHGPPRAATYTHLWLVDNDINFGLFSYDAFRALVSHRRPLLCQPAMLAPRRGRRATDRSSLIVNYTTTHSGGRLRLTDTTHTNKVLDDVDNQPLIDSALFAPLLAAIEPLNTRNQVFQARAMNIIARDLAIDAGLWPPHTRVLTQRPPHHLKVPPYRPAGLVFDFTPAIHMDTRLLGWGANAYKRDNGTRCPRIPQGPGLGEWKKAAEPALQKLTAARAQCGDKGQRVALRGRHGA